jgi:phosphate/sulfate permease
MPEFYLIAVILLFVLAISDLIVGVSNDAVNFLNSAIGSKVAPRRTIMIVASLGILVGATFSSGMMEVARKGIFNPQYFMFADIMVLFLAVMLTDIILLDLFNTFGMPTSTTVSIVFELLGAAMAVAVIKTLGAGEGLSSVGEYINGSNALAIILGIFLSVAVAFTIGTLVQYVSRLLFSFHYQKHLRWVGTIWSGIALAALTYFLLIKGIKGASFVSEEFVGWVKTHTWSLIGITALGWTLILGVLVRFFRTNILRLVVLFGTFALAMAFAGNDLVNFIGVPIAGYESYRAWMASGVDAGSFNMGVLSGAVPTQTVMLLGAGVIMIVTLWFSRKARSVTETEVNLGRQSEGLERFSANALSRGVVRSSYSAARLLEKWTPAAWAQRAERRFEPLIHKAEAGKDFDPPAFDLVRASVNLTVASALIALATSYKLPLSTTYVSFMVAMGTSLADRAWGRESAVYRVAGVLNVIGGWLATALIALTVSALFATLLYHFGGWAMLALVLLAITLIVRSFIYHRKKEKVKTRRAQFQRTTQEIPAQQLMKDSARQIAEKMRGVNNAYRGAIEGMLDEDRTRLRVARQQIQRLKQENEEFRYRFFGDLRRIREEQGEGSRLYLLQYDLEQDLLQSVEFIVNACHEHIGNVHQPLRGEQAQLLRTASADLHHYMNTIAELLGGQQLATAESVMLEKARLFSVIEEGMASQVDAIRAYQSGARNSLLFFSLLLETKDIVAVAARFVKLFHRLGEGKDRLIGN